MQGTIKYLCHHSQASLSTVARCTVLFLSPHDKLPRDTVPCYSAPSALQCTCTSQIVHAPWCARQQFLREEAHAVSFKI